MGVGLLALSFSFIDEPFLRLQKLQGTWVMKTKKGTIGETWKVINDKELSGSGFMVKGVDTISLEQVRLLRRNDGIYYESKVEGQNAGRAVPFKLIVSEGEKFVFENRTHDYPTTIIYSFITSDSLVARIEGLQKGVSKSSEFYYSRAK
jgi:hypothetical protein